MSLLLNIDTALDKAIISIAKDGEILQEAVNNEQKDHGAFLQPAIHSILKKAGIHLSELDAIAVVAGPGSYTGLRVGMATTKGLCYALNKPLITISSLHVLAWQAIQQLSVTKNDIPTLYCPMIDARRMEVFTATYNSTMAEILPAQAMLLNNLSFVEVLLHSKILFFGNGASKLQEICQNPNAIFEGQFNSLQALCELSNTQFTLKKFTDLAYSEPLYLKEFYNGH